MKVDINERKDNPFLDRKELRGVIEHEGEATPSIDALEEFLAEELNTDKENIDVEKIFTEKGRQRSEFWAKETGTPVEKETTKESKKEFECEECGKTFDSKRGLSAHKSQVHKEEEETEDYEEILSGTISEAKEKINDMESPDYEKLLEVEKDNKDRKGMKKFLKDKIGEQDE